MHAPRVLAPSTFALLIAACGAGESANRAAETTEARADATGATVADTALTPETDTFGAQPSDAAPAADALDDASTSPELVPEPGEFGAACTENSECASGWCVTSNLGPLCTRSCVDECPDGWSCVGISGGTDVTFLCVPKGDRACQPCAVDTQCGSGYCLEMEEGQRCTASCEDDSDCAAGFSCEMASSEVTTDRRSLQCIPAHDSCDCLPGREGLQRPCNNQSPAGTCWGLETCLGADGWSTCDAPVPSPEVCDGVDNNCNRFTDENLVDDTPCEKANTSGTCLGRSVCDGANGFVCVAPEAQPETCNFADDDCDGQVDEGFADPISGLYASDQNCGVCGNDCTGFFPNAISGCVSDGTSARCAVEACAAGYYQAGPSTCLPIVRTACLPCTDDANCVVPGNACVPFDGGSACAEDCAPGNLNGRPANSCDPGYSCKALAGTARRVCLPNTNSCACLDSSDAGTTRACTQTTAFGTCAGSQICNPSSGGFSACTARQPAAEVCNGQDDDCDGVVDEDVAEPAQACSKSNANGVCRGDWTCNGPAGWSCNALTPTAEVCNGRDDDCDAQTDEGFKNAAGIYTSDDHCGLCGRSCDSVVLFAEATECRVEGGLAVCVATACSDGFFIPPDTNRVCVPSSGAKDCSPCAADAQCSELADGKCTTVDDARFCTSGCSSTANCASGYACTGGRCLPRSGSCTCLPGDDGDLRPCVNQAAEGTCTGVSTCNSAASPGWSACSAKTPEAETCNGQDDNCDGRIDEGVVHDPPSCENTNADGTCTNVYRCDPVLGWVCPVETPTAERCNFQDDDCDGQTDEGFANAQGRYVSDENCGNCGSSCVGLIPNATAHCVDDGVRGRCQVQSCAAGYYQAGPLTCLPATDTACVPCASDSNCPTPGDRCLDLDGGKFCGRDCSAGNKHGNPAGACGTGYECKTIAALGNAQQCVPSSGSCSCFPSDRDDVRTCQIHSDAGTCFGTQTCTPETGWGGCSAATPKDEICNGVDDDCDGRVDESVVEPTNPCANTVGPDTCAAPWLCTGAGGWVCHAATPKAELCNGQDDDCDGAVDETFMTAGIYSDYSNCGACGISCEGAIPNAIETCSVTAGTARCVVQTCEPGYYQASSTTCLPATDSSCVPCVNDANCPTPGDLCLDLDGGRFCGRDCSASNKHGSPADECGDGYECLTIAAQGNARQCVPLSRSCSCRDDDRDAVRSCQVTSGGWTCPGTEVCVPEAGWGGCTARTPVAEVCNGEDDDCDGRVDEDVVAPSEPCAVSDGLDTCTAPWVCAGANHWVCNAATPRAEVCNGQDENCNGQADESFKNGDGIYATLTNCGACGISCVGAIPNATEKCTVSDGTARCEVATCDAGFYAASARTCLPATDTTCVPCLTDAHCPTPGDRCLALDGGLFCGRDCAAGNKHGKPEGACDIGFQCESMPDLGAGVRQCVPESRSCSCVGAAQGDARTCKQQNEFGTCFGSESCEIDSGWVGCDAREPAREVCDGIDNDCDGLVDEGVIEPDEPCIESSGGYTCSAPWVCSRTSAGWTCDAPVPVDELCDFVDNNCAGGIDEDFKNAAGKYVDLQNCGSCGISCVNAIPNASAVCRIGPTGNPRCEVGSCAEGFYKSSDLSCTGVTESLCAPCNIDSDCRTPGDLCVLLGGVKLCGQDCAAGNLHGTDPGECAPGFECLGFGDAQQCVPESGTCSCLPANDAATRACQRQNAAGTCFGSQTCDATSGWTTCTAPIPVDEQCNGVDDDCDGLVDEGVSHEPATCSEVVDGVGTCSASYTCRGVGGWQCAAATPRVEECNFVDDDCDTLVDETFKVDGRYVDDAHCGSCGVTCVGAIPNASATCRLSGTTPRCEVLACEAGYYQAGPLTCLPASDNTCAPCATDANCRTPGDRCVTLDGAKVCGRDCKAGNVHGTTSCPTGQFCKDFGADSHQCVPISQSCSCVAGDGGETRGCSTANTQGTCFGTQTCDPAAGWGACDARVPAIETCNALDDDCNFLTDDVPDRGTSCAITTPGVGTCQGVLDCVAGGGASLSCVGRTPASESCNYVDDDCNGLTDEVFGDLNQSCYRGEGACRRFGFQVCTSDGAGTQCNAVEGAPSAEICDGVDNDCDTSIDEGAAFALKGTPCTPGVGVCQRTGVYRCSDDGASVVCGVSAGQPSAETCNNLDDDCDGQVDEDFDKGQVCSVGTGTCRAFGNYICTGDGLGTSCNATAGQPAATELCDLLDDDCDGLTDENFKSQGTKYDSLVACGNCFTNCTAIFAGRPQAFGVCNAVPATPVCTMGCNSNYFDLNAVPGDGCEFGLDVTAIYVGNGSAGAVDDAGCGLGPVGTGVGNYPCRTIAQGLARAQAQSRTKVIVADGLYSEQVTLRNGISLLGGYRADTWERHLASSNTTIRGPTVTSGHAKAIIGTDITLATTLEGFIIYGGSSFAVGGNAYTIWLRDCGANLAIKNNLLFGGIAGPGSDGGNGAIGGDGTDGQRGERALPTQSNTGCNLTGNDPTCYDSGSNQTNGTCGVRGTNSCGGNVHGGNGAGATCPANNEQQPNGASGLSVAGGGAAGSAGQGGYSKYIRNDQTGCTITVGGNPTGLNGGDGGDGGDSSGASGCLDNDGSVSAGEWVGGVGAGASNGIPGGGGGGGGAGGGLDNQRSSCDAGGDRDTLGGSGGGGGAGGCGGQGGSGGTAGGGVFVVFLTSTSSTGVVPVLTGNVLTRGIGGDGGKGGNGGKGGLGGEGGDGGVVYGGYAQFIGPGGRGGQGGDGGHGGGGGGGCGGVSFGFFVHNITGTPNYRGVNTLVVSGDGGAGGSGGASPGNSGNPGLTGFSADANF